MQTTYPDKPFHTGSVQWQDRRWFDDRPKRTYRLRPLLPGEFPEVSGDTHVIVMKLSTDERQRLPISLLGVPQAMMQKLQDEADDDPVLDAVLNELFFAFMAGEQFQLGAVIRKALERAARGSKALH